MDPISAAISVGGSLLGGLFGNAKAKRERQQAIDDQRLQYVRLREAAELAGFNPLAVLDNAAPIMTPQVVPSTDYMGSAIADSAMLLAQNLATSGKAATAAKLNQYQTQNSRLQRQVQNLTLRPDVPGVYARNAAREAAAAAQGGSDRGRTGKPASDAHPLDDQLGTVDVPDPKLDRANPGFLFGINWEAAPGFSPGQVWEDRYGDTPLNWPLAMTQMSADFGYNARKGVNYAIGKTFGAGPVMTVGGKEFVLQPSKPKPKPKGREYWTHPQTGFSAPRRAFGF